MALGVGTVTAFCLTGQKIVNAYLDSILSDAMDTDEQSSSVQYGALGYGAMAYFVSLFGAVFFVRRYGRKTLLVTSLLLVALFMGMLGISNDIPSTQSYLPIISVVGFVSAVSIGIGPLAWAYAAEVSPERIRGLVSGVAVSIFWLFNFIWTLGFNEFEEWLSPAGVFYTFAGFSFFFAIVLSVYAVETKDRSLAELEEIFAGTESRAKSVDEESIGLGADQVS